MKKNTNQQNNINNASCLYDYLHDKIEQKDIFFKEYFKRNPKLPKHYYLIDMAISENIKDCLNNIDLINELLKVRFHNQYDCVNCDCDDCENKKTCIRLRQKRRLLLKILFLYLLAMEDDLIDDPQEYDNGKFLDTFINDFYNKIFSKK